MKSLFALPLSLTLFSLRTASLWCRPAHIDWYGSVGLGSLSWLQGAGKWAVHHFNGRVLIGAGAQILVCNSNGLPQISHKRGYQGISRSWETPVTHFISTCLSVWRGNRNNLSQTHACSDLHTDMNITHKCAKRTKMLPLDAALLGEQCHRHHSLAEHGSSESVDSEVRSLTATFSLHIRHQIFDMSFLRRVHFDLSPGMTVKISRYTVKKTRLVENCAP